MKQTSTYADCRSIGGKGRLHMKNVFRGLLSCCCLLAACTTLGPEKEWNNPADTPPVTSHCVPSVDSLTISGSPGVGDSMQFSLFAHCDDDSLLRHYWSFDGGKTFDSTTGSTLIRVWEMSDTGTQTIIGKVVNKNGVFSDPVDTVVTVGVSYPYIFYRIADTTVHQHAEVQKALVAADDDGVITAYYWSTGTDGWTDSVFSAEGTILSLHHPEGGAVTVRWAAVDDDGLKVLDTFTVKFNNGPDSVALLKPAKGTDALFSDYNIAENRGAIQCTFFAHDPDENDSLTYTFLAVDDKSDTLMVYQGKNDSIVLQNIAASTKITWWLSVRDAFGDSLTATGNFTAQRPPEMPKGMVLVAASSVGFRMGQSGFDTAEEPIHPVAFSQSFLIDSTEVTNESYNTIMHKTVDTALARFPVSSITWFEAVLYCNEKSRASKFDTVYSYSQISTENGHVTGLSDLKIRNDKYGFRLPTEAEWEYACKLDSLTLFFWGNDYSQASLYSWTRENSDGKKHRVATKRPSRINVYDMAGNVWEWCNDWFDGEYYKSSPTVDPSGPATGTNRVIRGGSYQHALFFAQAATRSSIKPDSYSESVGFRTVIKAR